MRKRIFEIIEVSKDGDIITKRCSIMKRIKRVIRFVSMYLAIILFIFDIYISAYISLSDYSSPPLELLGFSSVITFLMGLMILISGLFLENEENKLKRKRFAIIIGIFFSLGSLVAFLFIIPMLPPYGT